MSPISREQLFESWGKWRQAHEEQLEPLVIRDQRKQMKSKDGDNSNPNQQTTTRERQ